MGLSTLAELADVPEMDKQVHRVLERLQSLGKTAGTAMESSQVIAQFRIVPFDREGLRLVEHRLIGSPLIIPVGIGREPITEIVPGSRTLVHHRSERFEGSLGLHHMTHDTPGGSIHRRDHIHFVFLCPTNV